MAKRRTEKIIGFIFWVLATALLITAMLTDQWVTTSTFKFGLFDFCSSLKSPPCQTLKWLYDDPQTHVFINIFIPRMLMLAGAALVVIGILIGILDFCNTAACPIRTEGVLDILGGLSMLLGCTIFTARNFDAINISALASELLNNPISSLLTSITLPYNDGESFHFSFYFGWTSGLLYIIAGVCYVIAGKNR